MATGDDAAPSRPTLFILESTHKASPPSDEMTTYVAEFIHVAEGDLLVPYHTSSRALLSEVMGTPDVPNPFLLPVDIASGNPISGKGVVPLFAAPPDVAGGPWKAHLGSRTFTLRAGQEEGKAVIAGSSEDGFAYLLSYATKPWADGSLQVKAADGSLVLGVEAQPPRTLDVGAGLHKITRITSPPASLSVSTLNGHDEVRQGALVVSRPPGYLRAIWAVYSWACAPETGTGLQLAQSSLLVRQETRTYAGMGCGLGTVGDAVLLLIAPIDDAKPYTVEANATGLGRLDAVATMVALFYEDYAWDQACACLRPAPPPLICLRYCPTP